MAGQYVPIVLLPRYTTYVGGDTFTTMPIDISAYQAVNLNFWRSPLVGTSPTFALTVEESIDSQNWTTVSGISAGVDPGPDAETPYAGTLKKRWLRAKVVIAGTANAVSATCWLVGFLEMRQ